MKNDPYYQSIEEGLNRTLDPDAFELCVCDLLRADWPTLVPIRGGKDAGMDGAVADGEGEPFPLITTTQKDVIGNLTKSLTSYLREGKPRRKAILATSRALTPIHRRKLEKRAEEKDFTLVQTYDQADIAPLLYSNPKWCKELFGLTGSPPALSRVPKSCRPRINKQPIGREESLKWLETTKGDKLLAGQPGSGKTFLLNILAEKGQALFVVDEDIGKIADSFREMQPGILIIDDAHVRVGLLESLLHWRSSLDADFSILASSWPNEREQIADVLSLPEAKVHKLDLLERDAIVEVVKDGGIAGPTWLVHEIVNQANGCPGLAATLTHLCLQGDVPRVVKGDILLGQLKRAFQSLVGDNAFVFLAHFGLAGASGAEAGKVAALLDCPAFTIKRELTQLAAAGVVLQARGSTERLIVHPRALRHVLVRDAFFEGPVRHNLESAMEACPSFGDCVITLVGAKFTGATMQKPFLLDLVEKAASDEVWAEYAPLGKTETQAALRNDPRLVSRIPTELLAGSPEDTLPLLLEKAVGDNREPHAHLNHPLRVVSDWVKAARPNTPAVMSRRRVLLDVALNWLADGSDSRVGAQAVRFALMPGFEVWESDPGLGRTYAGRKDWLTEDELKNLMGLWPKANSALGDQSIDWGPLIEMARDWTVSSTAHRSAKSLRLTRSFARQVLRDLVVHVKNSPGHLAAIQSLCRALHMKMHVPVPEDFGTLFPEYTAAKRRNYEAAQRRELKAVESLAAKWLCRPPREVAQRVAFLDREQLAADRTWPRWTPQLCAMIAGHAQRPVAWLRALKREDAKSDLVQPFLQRILLERRRGWRKHIEDCLTEAKYVQTAREVLIVQPKVPGTLLEKAMMALDDTTDLRVLVCFNAVPVSTVRRLLSHEAARVAGSAAIGEFLREPKGEIREELRSLWRKAIVHCTHDDFHLKQIISGDPALAFDWLCANLADLTKYSGPSTDVASAVAVVLPDDARKEFLKAASGHSLPGELVAILVEEPDVYRQLLADPGHKCNYLSPLRELFSASWEEKAKLALAAGIEPLAITHELMYGGPFAFVSREEDTGLAEFFDGLRASPERGVRAIAEEGLKLVAADQRQDAERDRQERIYGRGRE